MQFLTPTLIVLKVREAGQSTALAQVQAAAARAGRDPEEITLIAVSKTKSIDLIAEAAAAGPQPLSLQLSRA